MSVPAPDAIVSVEISRCALPLERPVHIGRTVYREREYVTLVITTAAGIEGHAIGYTRGLPLDAMLRPLADGILGQRVTSRAAVVDGLLRSNINAAGSLGRAFSLVDIALADALARVAVLPLWSLVGGARRRVPLMAVAGYHAGERGAADVADEVLALTGAGFRHVKLHTADAAIVAAVMERVGDGVSVGVDAAMAWGSLPAALEACRPLDDLGLAFIEDPFRPEHWRLTAELAGRLRTPIAAGEDAATPSLLVDLAGVVDVLRVDATVSGGFGAVLDAATLAAARGATAMTHAFPDQHAHLAGAPAIGLIEMIPEETGLNPVGQLLARRQRIDEGELVLSEEPGHGAPLDPIAVERSARDRSTLTTKRPAIQRKGGT
jgi:L-alanine-DL-glutamate epimerase-like enolase superfamily enzyme